MIKQFLPSIARGVYRLDQELCQYKKNDDITGFIQNKLAFLPSEYRDFIDKRLGLDEASEAQALLSKFCPSRKSAPGIRKKYQSFFEQHHYFDNWNNANNAKNFLEIEFVKKILSSQFTLEGLYQFEPQKKIGRFYADFAIQGNRNYVIEIDGFTKFKAPDALDHFLNRQNYLVKAGWTVYRYSYQDIMQNAKKTVNDLYKIFDEDEQLRYFLEQNKKRGSVQQISFNTNNHFDSCELVNLFYAIQDYFVEQGQSKPEDEDEIVYITDNLAFDFPLSALALSNLYYYFENLIKIFEVSFHFPEIYILMATTSQDLPEIHPKITLNNDASYLSKSGVLKLDKHFLLSRQRNLPFLKIENIPFRDQKKATDEEIAEKLHYFATSIFGYKEVRLEQAPIFKKIFNGSNVLGLLPTGSGKSFCFWLPALLKPGLTIIISPLRSLMRDQDFSLKMNIGIYSTAFINSDVSEPERQAIYIDIKLGRIKLLYIAPERLRINNFRAELDSILESIPVNFLVIDEAHCVSEWGHDFRPSYLGIPDFMDYIKKYNPKLTLIALTATAGDVVKQDMMNILGLCEENVVSAHNFDRHNLSYQVIKVNSYESKANAYQRVIKHNLHTALKKQNISEVLNSDNVGLVFCIYADPHGQHSIKDGIAHYLQETQALLDGNDSLNESDFGSGKIRGFSSKSPTLCPCCHSPYYINAKKVEQIDDDREENKKGSEKICMICRNRFEEPLKPKKWESLTKENQKAFKQGELDLLISTKGFGMGIDKGSVRFVVHTSMAGGLEAWYQEAGRSGRDNKHAHCVQIIDMPNDDCKLDMNNRTTRIPACSAFRCPFGKEGLCDYGKQHAFISGSYPSVGADLIRVLRVLDKLINSIKEGTQPVRISTSYSEQSHVELALYRLTIIGYISYFFINYGRNVEFEIVLADSFSNDKAIHKLLDYLKRNDISQTKKYEYYTEADVIADIEKHRERYWDDIEDRIKREQKKGNIIYYSDYSQFFTNIAEYMLVILHHTYDEIKVMRYEILETLKNVIDNSDDCQRKMIVNYFDTSDEGIIKGDYQCGFCSHCVEDLNFQRDYAKPLEFSLDSRDIQLRLQESFKQPFDFEKNQKLANDLKNYPKYAYVQAVSTLSGSPRNLTAWFFAREFSPEDTRNAHTLDFIKIANEDLALDEVNKIYNTTHNNLKPKAFDVLDDEYGACNNTEGEQWLYEQAQQLGIDEERKAKLEMRVIANKLETMEFSRQLHKTEQLLKDF